MKIKPNHIVIAVVAIIIAAFALPQILADAPGARSVQDNVITETIGVVETNATAVFAINLLEGGDAEHESTHVFEALLGVPGVGKASLNTDTLELTVAYDAAGMDEIYIRERLVEAGYITPTVEDATPMELSDDGSVQTMVISDDGTHFDPYLISAKSGIPIEFEFLPGQECRHTVKFPQLGIVQDISQGGTVVLGALEPGDYQIACSGDGNEGSLVVE